MIPSFSQKYNFIDDDIFHKKIESCVDPEKDEQINVYFCMYSITHTFFIEGPSSPIDEDTNIYGHVLDQYGIYYPCLRWLVQKNSDTIYHFPKIKYNCVSIPQEDNYEDDASSMETIHFENAAHEYFLSMFSQDVIHKNRNLFKNAYKGYYSPKIQDSDSSKYVYVIYDFSELYPFFILNENMRLIINAELHENTIPVSPEVVHFFDENHFLTRIKGLISPTFGYLCIYNESTKKWENISIDAMDRIEHMLPYEHPLLGCNAYYLSKKPLDPTTNSEKIVKMACIESRIMYDISINDKNEIFYIGDNIEEFKYDFQIGLLMASTFHLRENGNDFIGIKNLSHMHRIFPHQIQRS